MSVCVWPPSLRGKEILRPDLQTDGLGIRPLSGSLVLAACCTQACPYAPCTSHPVANAQLIQYVELFLTPHEYDGDIPLADTTEEALIRPTFCTSHEIFK